MECSTEIQKKDLCGLKELELFHIKYMAFTNIYNQMEINNICILIDNLMKTRI